MPETNASTDPSVDSVITSKPTPPSSGVWCREDERISTASRTPWGKVQTMTEVASGIWDISTQGHGGIKLSRARNRGIPAGVRMRGGWYEEDVEWAIVVMIYRDEFRAYMHRCGHQADHVERMMTGAARCVRGAMPETYELITGIKVRPGESSSRDEAQFFELHKNDWIVVSALRCSEKPGFVVCSARIGGRNSAANTESRTFLIEADEYAARSSFGFVVDPMVHPISPITISDALAYPGR